MGRKLSIKKIVLYLIDGLMIVLGVLVDIDICKEIDLLETSPILIFIIALNVFCGFEFFVLTAIDSISKIIKTNIIARSIFLFIIAMLLSMFISADWSGTG